MLASRTAPFTLLSDFGTTRIKLVPVPSPSTDKNDTGTKIEGSVNGLVISKH